MVYYVYIVDRQEDLLYYSLSWSWIELFEVVEELFMSIDSNGQGQIESSIFLSYLEESIQKKNEPHTSILILFNKMLRKEDNINWWTLDSLWNLFYRVSFISSE
jgi:hypothetical protein